MEIIGVAKDAKYDSLRVETAATVYHPFRQADIQHMHFEVRTAGDPKALIADVRSVVRERTGVDLEPEVRIIGERA